MYKGIDVEIRGVNCDELFITEEVSGVSQYINIYLNNQGQRFLNEHKVYKNRASKLYKGIKTVNYV